MAAIYVDRTFQFIIYGKEVYHPRTQRSMTADAVATLLANLPGCLSKPLQIERKQRVFAPFQGPSQKRVRLGGCQTKLKKTSPHYWCKNCNKTWVHNTNLALYVEACVCWRSNGPSKLFPKARTIRLTKLSASQMGRTLQCYRQQPSHCLLAMMLTFLPIKDIHNCSKIWFCSKIFQFEKGTLSELERYGRSVAASGLYYAGSSSACEFINNIKFGTLYIMQRFLSCKISGAIMLETVTK